MPFSANSLFRLLPVLLLAGLFLVACGGEDGEGDASSGEAGVQPPPTQIALATPETGVADGASDAVDQPANATAGDGQPMSGDQPTLEPALDAASDPTATPEPVAEPANPAPEIGSIDSWHNSPPLTLAELRGAPVLLVFWADF